jgi:hypothetical protein
MGRRNFIKLGALGLTGLTMTDWLRRKACGEIAEAKAKSVILMFLNGGPSQLESFDPKPDAPAAFAGPHHKAIETNVKGIYVNELMPLTAKCADKYSIIRSMTHEWNGHELGQYVMLSGMPAGGMAYPTVGSVVSLKKGYDAGYQGSLPPFITVVRRAPRCDDAGFLGATYRSFLTGGDPNEDPFSVNGFSLPPGVTEDRLQRRRSILETINAFSKGMEKDRNFQALGSLQQSGCEMILGAAREAFDLSKEEDPLRERYGRNCYGQATLCARRLVERGVPFVNVNWHRGQQMDEPSPYKFDFDTHANHLKRVPLMHALLDSALSALLEDLSDRGLLESTIVVCVGEFGRSPRIATKPPYVEGRGHYCKAFSALVAGGGFKGGQVVGETDETASNVVSRPTYPWDLWASVYRLLGIDPNGPLPDPSGCVVRVSPIASGKVPTGGILTEIM